tara:strand:+ start:360 stop:1514 length:1155 start_codon:yes stop_codon:yes gene_type:complete
MKKSSKIKKTISRHELESELLGRVQEVVGSSDGGTSDFYRWAEIYTQWVLAHEMRLSFTMCRRSDFSKEELRDHLIKACDGMSCDVRFDITDNPKDSLDELETKINKRVTRISNKEMAEDIQSGKLKPTGRFGFLPPPIKNSTYINEMFKVMSLENIQLFFDEYRHVDWFEAVHEIDSVGSGPDLLDLICFGFTGFLAGGELKFSPWTLREITEWDRLKGPQKSIDPIIYIKKLIENCEAFMDANPLGGINGIGDGDVLFRKALRFAKTRLKLDTEKFVDANELAYFCGLDERTLANNYLLQPKKKNESVSKVLCKDALNFLVYRIRPDKSPLQRERKRVAVAIDRDLKKDFYRSIWKEQVKYKVYVNGHWDDDMQIIESKIFK